MPNLDASYKNLDRVIIWIQNADSKASISLAFDAAAMALIIDKLSNIISFIKNEALSNEVIVIGTIILFCAFIISFILSVYNAFRVLLPNIKINSHNKLFFFKTIASMSLEEFERDMKDISDEKIAETVNEQTHINSQIASRKFCYLQKSWIYLIASIISGILLVAGSFIIKLG